MKIVIQMFFSSDTMLNFLYIYQLGLKQRVLHLSSNEVLIQNQLEMIRVTHKLIHKLKFFNYINVGQYPLSYAFYFINVGQYPLLYFNTLPHVCAIVANQDRATCSDTIISLIKRIKKFNNRR